MKKITIFLLRIIISFGLLFFIFQRIDIRSVASLIPQFNPALLSLSFLFFVAAFVLCFFRWKMLVGATGTPFSVKKMFITFWGSQFFILFLPSFIGADIMRAADLGADVKNVKRIAATVVLDRISGYAGLLIVALTALALGFRMIDQPIVFGAMLFLCLLLGAILFFLFHPGLFEYVSSFLKGKGRIRGWFSSLYGELHYFRQYPAVLVRNIFISLGVQFLMPAMYYVLLSALGISVNALLIFILMPIVSAISILPVSIGGLGVRELGAVYFLGKFGIPESAAVAVSLMNFFFLMALSLIGGIVYVLTFRSRRV
jgi:glycosyltransferase 2 family protein